jgi:enamine deaminase RidA (YjgF/YER057c/UK114 family)
MVSWDRNEKSGSRAVRDEFIDTDRPPASTAVQVMALVRPEFLLEVEALALAGDGN